MKIGIRIKDLRLKERVTLMELARKTGLTTSFLSQLERELTSPSINSLEKIAAALNKKIGYFFEESDQKGLVVIRKGMGKKFVDTEKKILYEKLPSGLLNMQMEPYLYTLGPGGVMPGETDLSDEESFCFIIKGKVEFLSDNEKIILEEGDSIYCMHPHCSKRLTNVSDGESRFLWIKFSSV
jgi:transcriptional regulator with XRE-family HTH domain